MYRTESLSTTTGSVAPTSHVSPLSPASALQDGFGREVNYLRLSVTDRCDFRCTYCMGEDVQFLPHHQVMSLEECLALVSAFVQLGVKKVRITGGEPLVRRNILWLLERVARLPGLGELVLTTNGSQLAHMAAPLRAAGVARLNISLDTLDPQAFRALTRTGHLDQVIAGIDAARAAGFQRIKLNTVMQRGVNDHALAELVAFARDRELDIAFIEEMPLGTVGHDRRESLLGSDEVRRRLAERFDLLPTTETTGGPARYWRLGEGPTRVGFISPHSHNFCDRCNRVRVNAKGELYTCLGQDHRVSLLAALRTGEPLAPLIRAALQDKARGHDFTAQMAAPKVLRFMSATGG